MNKGKIGETIAGDPDRKLKADSAKCPSKPDDGGTMACGKELNYKANAE